MEGDRAGARDQARELVATGDQDQAPGRGRQQRPNLLNVPRVIQQHQHPPLGQHTAVQRGLRIQPRRYPLHRHAKRIQERAHHLTGRRDRPAPIEPTQVHIQLPVREPAGGPLRPVHRECRLADAGHAGHG